MRSEDGVDLCLNTNTLWNGQSLVNKIAREREKIEFAVKTKNDQKTVFGKNINFKSEKSGLFYVNFGQKARASLFEDLKWFRIVPDAENFTGIPTVH